MNKKRNKKKRSFLLIELLIALAVASVVFSASYSALSSLIEGKIHKKNRLETELLFDQALCQLVLRFLSQGAPPPYYEGAKFGPIALHPPRKELSDIEIALLDSALAGSEWKATFDIIPVQHVDQLPNVWDFRVVPSIQQKDKEPIKSEQKYRFCLTQEKSP